MRGATVTQLADILKRAVQDHGLGITAILEDAPIERVREHWPAHAARLELMRCWHAPGHIEGFLNDTGIVAQITTGLEIEPGNKLRVLILWGSGAPPLEADTCILSQVRVRWSDLAAELEAAGFDEVGCETCGAVGGAAANKRQDRDAATHSSRPSREKPFWPAARGVAWEWLRENGYPAVGDGGQAGLEQHLSRWLEARGHTASESTVRRHVKRWIEEFRAELDEGVLGS
jgi:hypothetical protein